MSDESVSVGGAKRPSASLFSEPFSLMLVSVKLTVTDFAAFPDARDSVSPTATMGSAKRAMSSMCVARCFCSSQSRRPSQHRTQEASVVSLSGWLETSRIIESWGGDKILRYKLSIWYLERNLVVRGH